MSTIICGTDFTRQAQAAADVAAAFARALGAELRLVHVDEQRDPTAVTLDSEAARLRAEHAIAIATQRLVGTPAAELARVAREAGAVLIVVGAIGPTPSIFRVGGTAERVAQASHAPVLLVRDPAPLLAWLRGESLSMVAMIGDDAASDRVVEWLRAARQLGACDISILHAYYVDEAVRRYGLGRRPLVIADPEIAGYVRRDLEHRTAPLGGRGTTSYHAVLALGRLADHLTDHPAVQGAGLVVVGNHRVRGVARLSSVAAGVVHLAPVSLLVVPTDAPAVAAAPLPEIRRVLAATDFSEFAATAVRHAYGLLAGTGGEVTLLHVTSAKSSEEACLADLRALVPALPPAGVATVVLAEHHGDAATAILEVAARTGADCIVIASHGRTGLRSLLLGSVAREVVHRARRPVLIVRPPDDL